MGPVRVPSSQAHVVAMAAEMAGVATKWAMAGQAAVRVAVRVAAMVAVAGVVARVRAALAPAAVVVRALAALEMAAVAAEPLAEPLAAAMASAASVSVAQAQAPVEPMATMAQPVGMVVERGYAPQNHPATSSCRAPSRRRTDWSSGKEHRSTDRG